MDLLNGELMSTVKLQGPDNFGGFSHAGAAYKPDDDGIIEVPAHIPSDVIASHGLKLAEIKKGPKKLEPLAKSAKGDAKESALDENIGDTTETVIGGDEVKPAQKGAKLAKGGEQ